jgi:hypothetical protein
VWIVWEGRHPLRLSLLDGTPLGVDHVAEDAVGAAAVRLRLGERRLLVDQVLGIGALADMPWPRRLAPPSFLAGRERKWLAVGELILGGTAVEEGDVIRETVDWSWRAWDFGPFRVISHAAWTAAAAGVGTLLAALLAGPGGAIFLALVVAGGLIGALLFGRLVEGRHLSRPFGYFGFLLAALVVLTIIAMSDGPSAASLAAAVAAAAPLAQAIGRGRCLVQGCCHGGPDAGRFAIRVENPMSRIACLAHLRGTPVGATQLFSASVNVAIAAVLLRLWGAAAPASLICGLYLVLTGLARFAEEGSRGEPQTPVLAGLTIYQWLSITAFVAGAAVTMTPSAPVHPVLQLDAASAWVALAAAAVSTLAMSVDWPRTRLPMSLLAPPDTALAAREQLSSRPVAGSRPS